MRHLMLIAVVLMAAACGGDDGTPGGLDAGSVDATLCRDPALCDQAGEAPTTTSTGEWTLIGDLESGATCAAIVELRICVRDERTADIMVNGEIATTAIGIRAGLADPNLGPAVVGDAVICGVFLQEDVRFQFTTCDCDAQYISRAPTHDPSGCPSFP